MNNSYIDAMNNLYVSYSVPCNGSRPHEYALCSNHNTGLRSQPLKPVIKLMKPRVVDEADKTEVAHENYLVDEPDEADEDDEAERADVSDEVVEAEVVDEADAAENSLSSWWG